MSAITDRSADIIARLPRFAVRFFRRAVGASFRALGFTEERSRRAARKLDARLEAQQRPIAVKPIADIPAPQVDLAGADALSVITGSAEFKDATAFFADNPVTSRSLVSPQSQALLYCIIRNLRPQHVFEIGSFRAGTTEAICRALHANGGRGLVHAVDPFCGEYIKLVFKHWPPALRERARLYETNSMAFFMEQQGKGIRPSLVFVDGNHDYEFALFDIGCGARATTPGGFIVVDNIAQAGPFFAARDFLAANPGWRELGSSVRDFNPDKAFDAHRTTIINTDFMVLQAPTNRLVDEHPSNFGTTRCQMSRVDGVRLKFVPPSRPGVLAVQVVLRGFGTKLSESLAETTAQVTPDMDQLSISFAEPAQLSGQFVVFEIEPWLIWRAEEPLQLVQPPEPF